MNNTLFLFSHAGLFIVHARLCCLFRVWVDFFSGIFYSAVSQSLLFSTTWIFVKAAIPPIDLFPMRILKSSTLAYQPLYLSEG